MNCARCNRPLQSVALWIGGLAIGPKCAAKMGAHRAHVPQAVRCDQPGLFDDVRVLREGERLDVSNLQQPPV